MPGGDRDYAETEAPLSEVLPRLVAAAGEPRPLVVFLYSTAEGEKTDACDDHLDADEEAALSLERFRRYRIDVETVASDRIREDLGETPAYVFFDPAGREVSRVSGDRASDCRSFEGALERAWRAAFETGHRRFLAAMTDILDEKADVEARRAGLEEDRNRLRARPNPRKEQAIEREDESLRKEWDELLDLERKTKDSVALRDEFVRETEAVSGKD